MKITEQFDDLEVDQVPIGKLKKQSRRNLLRSSARASEASARIARNQKSRRSIKPSLPRFKCLEDA